MKKGVQNEGFCPLSIEVGSYMVKEDVIKLKIEGKSYSEISRLLGVSESTVKTIYNRFKNSHPESFCPMCSKFLIQTKGSRQKRFCSSKCKDHYWNLMKNQKNK